MGFCACVLLCRAAPGEPLILANAARLGEGGLPNEFCPNWVKGVSMGYF
jgi:hypothetical protein